MNGGLAPEPFAAVLAPLFDRFVEDALDGRDTDLAPLVAEHPELRARIEDCYRLAREVAGRRSAPLPRLPGFEVLRPVGRGGMGIVYLARQTDLERPVALKVLPEAAGLDPRARQRFVNEARALGRLRHEHIVRVHQVIDNGEVLGFAMEWIDGPSLRQVLDRLRSAGRPATLEDLAGVLGVEPATLGARDWLAWLLRTGVTVARALAVMHAAGLVHRDVKPSNVLLRADGQPVLADLGLVQTPQTRLTQSGAFVGTPVYAPPEQLRGDHDLVDARADVYALGVTLYEAVAGQPPIAGKTTTEILRRIEQDQVPPLRRLAPQAPRDLETVIGKAMALDPRQRYATARELAEDLQRLLDAKPILARAGGWPRHASQIVHRNRRPLAAASLGAVVMLACVLALRLATPTTTKTVTASADSPFKSRPFASLKQVEAWTARLVRFHRDGLETMPLPAPASPEFGLALLLSRGARVVCHFPEVLVNVDPILFVPALVAARWTRQRWSSVVRRIPALLVGLGLLESGNAQHHLFTWSEPTNGAQSGHAVASIGDVNGDGRPDVAIGAPNARVNAIFPGTVTAYSGTDGRQLWQAVGLGHQHGFGHAVAGCGDVNADGVPDVAVGAPAQNQQRGQVYVLSGATGLVLRTSLFGTQLSDWFGGSLAAAGDIDRDGTPDILAGTLVVAGQGYAQVLSGRTAAVIATLPATTASSRLGWSVAGLGDLNADGIPDVAVGDPSHSTPSNATTGRVIVYSGASLATGPVVLHALTGASANEGFGTAIGSAGDVDLDGVQDLVVGAPNASYSFPASGSVYVFSGRTGRCCASGSMVWQLVKSSVNR